MLAAACAFAPRARADDDSDRVAADRLAAIAHDQAVLDGKERLGVIVGVVVGGAVATGIGVPLMVDALSQPTPLSTDIDGELIGGIMLTSFGAAALLSWPFAFIRTPAERLDERLRELASLPPHERLGRAEGIFEQTAVEERRQRRMSGVLDFVLAGINAVIVPFDALGTERWVAGLNGTAAAIGIVAGALQFATAGPIERAWRTWLVGTGRPVAVRFTPIVTPAGGGFSLTF